MNNNLKPSITLKGTYCEFCNVSNFFEHENGYYVCSDCGLQTNINHSVMLQFNDFDHRGPKIKIKIKSDEEDLMNDTTFATGLVYTSVPSELSESEHSIRKSLSLMNRIKELKEVLLSVQDGFFKGFFLDFYVNDEGRKTTSNMNMNISMINSLNISQMTRFYWKDYLSNQIEIYMKLNKDEVIRQPRRKRIRSRYDSMKGRYSHIDETTKKLFPNESLLLTVKKRTSILDKMIYLKINHKNILRLDDYININIDNIRKYQKFIEEYYQVKKFLKFNSNTLNYKMIYSLGKHFKLEVNTQSTYEEIIHKFYQLISLKYRNNKGENQVLEEDLNEDETKNNFLSDNLIALKYVIFNMNNQLGGMITYDIINNYRSFDVLDYNKVSNNKKIYVSDLKYMKHVNFDKLVNYIQLYYTDFQSKALLSPVFPYRSNIKKISKLIGLTEELGNISLRLYYYIYKDIQVLVSSYYQYEIYQYAVIIYILKSVYGLNNYPYLLHLIDYKQSFLLNTCTSPINFSFSVIEKQSLKSNDADPLSNLYSSLPSLLSLLKNMTSAVKSKETSHLLWEKKDFKKYNNDEYKRKYIQFNKEILFEERSNIGISKKIKSLNDFKSQFVKVYKPNSNRSDARRQLHIVNKNQHYDTVLSNIDRLKDSHLNDLNGFVKEEVNFYSSVQKKIEKESGSNKRIQVPLPVDTIIKFNRKSFKSNHSSNEIENYIFLLFKLHFNISITILKDVLRRVDTIIDRRMKKI